MFAKGAHYALKELSDSDYDVVGLDWTMEPTEARYVLPITSCSLAVLHCMLSLHMQEMRGRCNHTAG